LKWLYRIILVPKQPGRTLINPTFSAWTLCSSVLISSVLLFMICLVWLCSIQSAFYGIHLFTR